LGVVDNLTLIFGAGMTAVTGETGAGKTMLVEAIRLLTGGKSETQMIRSGADEAVVEGRFVIGDEEHVLTRVVPTSGRSRAYLDGRMVPLAALAEAGERLVDLHGQNAHQALLSPVAQRRALDAFGKVDLSKVRRIQSRLNEIEAEMNSLGGDVRMRAREIDLLRFQLEEIDAAALADVAEDESLRREEDLLADASAHREAAQTLHDTLTGDRGVSEQIDIALRSGEGREPLAEIQARLRSVAAEVADLGLESSQVVGRLQDDPERLAWVQERRQQLKQLQRKYGPELSDVIRYGEEARGRLGDLERHDEKVARLETDREMLQADLVKAQSTVRKARVKAAPQLASRVEQRLRSLALPNARFAIEVGEALAGDDVVFLLGPNPGMPLLPLAKAASGGELARSMLALRLTLIGVEDDEPSGATTLIFDEVDAGIGGAAAVAVGGSLAALAHGGPDDTQVLVVTHLPQVAAFADHQVTVSKQQDKDRTVAEIQVLDLRDREVELARMLSGRPDSKSGRAHARELLEQASQARETARQGGH
jgi:DNA repair protein RecN (Recombination protein N)